MSKSKKIVISLLGPALFFVCYFFLPESVFVTRQANAAVGTIVWMALWWITGVVDFAVTAFLPIAINSLFQITDMSAVISNYASETILLLLGASILTASWEETGLDRRIAAKFLSFVGSSATNQIVFWYLLCAILSSILPNAVVCATMTPIAVSMLQYIGQGDIKNSKFGSLLLLTIAYSTGVGGLASPLGGAMNLVAVDYLEQVSGQEYMYVQWVIRFLPIMIVLVVSNIIMLLYSCRKCESINLSKDYFKKQYSEMPKMTKVEIMSLTLFLVATALSFSRQFYQELLPGLKPAYVFIICGILSFFITHKSGEPLMTWKSTQRRIVWDLMYVFAGGLALGTLINNSGVAKVLGGLVTGINFEGDILLILVIVAFTVILSDITSNTATAAVALPIVISIAQGLGRNPIPYIYIAIIGVNLSYMLPTSIRAIPVGYGLEPKYMLKKGMPITVVVIVLMSLISYIMLRLWPAFSTTV